MDKLLRCPGCGHLNRLDSEICERCGARTNDLDYNATTNAELMNHDVDVPDLPDLVTTRRIDAGPEHNEPRWGDARIDAHTRLLVYVIHYERSVNLDMHATGAVVVGRQQLGVSAEPKLDLSAFDALEAGVSRQHARFELKDASLYITDLDSTNGTYLNGLRILPWQPRVVRDGDEVRLGMLKLQILFVHPAQASPPGGTR